jgi:flagellar biosynthesis GTPase FlhF
MAGEAEATRDRAVKLAQVGAQQAVEVANQEREQAGQTAAVMKTQAVAVAERGREIAIAVAEEKRALAEAGRLKAEQAKAQAEQAVLTVEVTAEAEREKRKAIISKEAETEQEALQARNEANLEAYRRVKQAEGEQEAALKQAEAQIRLAEAEKEAALRRAEGRKAEEMVPVTVDREKVGVESARAIRSDHGPADVIVANNVMAHVPDIRGFVGWMAANGFRIPVHLQEPFRRDYQAYNPIEDDFYRDDTGAKIAEAAGWCWHNGSGPVVYRSFLMDDARGRLYSQIDSVEVNVTNNSYDRIGALNTNARRYHAEYSEQLSHQIGRQEGSVWSANTAQDATGYLVYGPYIDTVPSGNHSADWRLSIDNNTANNEAVLGLDVYSNGQTLAGRTVTRQEFTAANTFQTFSLNFTSTGQQDLEFRVYWLDKAYIKCDWVQLNMSQTTYSGTPNNRPLKVATVLWPGLTSASSGQSFVWSVMSTSWSAFSNCGA